MLLRRPLIIRDTHCSPAQFPRHLVTTAKSWHSDWSRARTGWFARALILRMARTPTRGSVINVNRREASRHPRRGQGRCHGKVVPHHPCFFFCWCFFLLLLLCPSTRGHPATSPPSLCLCSLTLPSFKTKRAEWTRKLRHRKLTESRQIENTDSSASLGKLDRWYQRTGPGDVSIVAPYLLPKTNKQTNKKECLCWLDHWASVRFVLQLPLMSISDSDQTKFLV